MHEYTFVDKEGILMHSFMFITVGLPLLTMNKRSLSLSLPLPFAAGHALCYGLAAPEQPIACHGLPVAGLPLTCSARWMAYRVRLP